MPRFTGVIQLIDYILSLAKFTANQQRNADNIVRLATDGSRYWNGLSKCSGHKWDGTALVICPYQSVTSVLAAWHVSTESSFLSTTASSATDNNTSHALMMRFTNITENYTHTHTRLTALFPGLPRWAGTRKVKPIWSKRQWEAVVSAGPYASLHLAPDR